MIMDFILNYGMRNIEDKLLTVTLFSSSVESAYLEAVAISSQIGQIAAARAERPRRRGRPYGLDEA